MFIFYNLDFRFPFKLDYHKIGHIVEVDDKVGP